ncbi:MAG: tight adherence protein [Actinomycetota bacterium]|jgi:tight adherence protein B|nr:tight adherence protein [Actinomycetota bacterium]
MSTAASWCAALCAALAYQLGWAARPHPGLARLSSRPRTTDRSRVVARLLAGGLGSLAGRRSAARRRTALVALADGLAAELRAGAAPRPALEAAARACPLLPEVAAAARSPAGDVAGALSGVGRLPGGEAGGDLAVLWTVCEAAGAGLAGPAARLAAGLRDEEQVRREVRAQLAGPRATAWLLAGLPAFGLLMGAALGAAPWRLLVGPTAVVLVVPGLALEAAGLLWSRQLTRRAERG